MTVTNNSGNNPQPFTITIGSGGASGTISQTITVPNSVNYITVPLDAGQLCLPFEEVTEKKNNSDGCVCKKCKNLFPFAEPNQEDGTLICYECRMIW